MNTVKMKPLKKTPKKRAYHHGDLKDQLVAAAEAIILEKGVEGFTLREAARRAGVSPAAPAHHFNDAKGLLAEVALRGFRDFGDALDAADRRESDPHARLVAQGVSYVNFALKYPARLQLMFTRAKYDTSYPGLAPVSQRAFQILERAVRAATDSGTEPLTKDAMGYLIAVWSIVHGFSHLLLGGEMDGLVPSGGKRAIVETFLPLTLKHLPIPAASQKTA
ncbi:MAG: TetR/AcrR family transcriptional regulator [Alphaproteobacteria bacterium]|nr:TetR/AcrR family transcriptional regulator [Alphaproteobacteria bacterium]